MCALFLTWVVIIIILGVVVMVNKRMKMVMGMTTTHQNGDEDRRWFELPSHKVSHKQCCQQ